MKTQRKSKLSHTNATYKALNAAVIPESQDPAKKQGSIQLSGTSEHGIDEYHIWSLNHCLSQTMLRMVFNIPLAKPTAKLLDKASVQLIKNRGNKEPINSKTLHEAGAFAALAPGDRLRALTLLEQLKVHPLSLPIPFFNNPGLLLSTLGTVMMLITFGHYSGWSGYGSTSLETPEKRTAEYFPACWKQIGYPGTSKGYHGLRGYLIDKFTE